MQQKNLWFWLISLGVVAIDQVTKWWIVANLGPTNGKVSIIPGFFEIVYAQNPGAAMGFLRDFEHRQWLFIGFTIVAVAIIGNMQRQLAGNLRFLPAVLGMILGGTMGNGIDRVHKQTVTDFLRFFTESPTWKHRFVSWFGTAEYPSFNVADMALVIGVGLFVVHYLFLDEGEFEPNKAKKEPAKTETPTNGPAPSAPPPDGGMHPILFHLGSVPIHTYGVMGALGFLVSAYTVLRRSRDLFLNRDHVVDVIFWGSISALAGARILFVLQNPAVNHGVGSWFNIRGGGLVFYGALLTGMPVAALVMRWRNIPRLMFMDVVAAAAPLGHGLARLGCLAAGCCWGRPTDLPWAVTYSDPLTDAPHGMGLHPVQAYESAGLFAIAAVCAWRYPRKAFDGEILLIYLLGYALLRFVTEGFRGDSRGWFLEGWLGQSLSSSQGVSLLVAAVAVGIGVWARRRALQKPAPTA